MATQENLPPERSAARFAVIGALALLLIAACASAFSMLAWNPMAHPTTATAVLSERSGPVQPDRPRLIETSWQNLSPGRSEDR
jgi:hypothetical protein